MWFNPIGDQQVSGRCVGLSLDTVEAHPVLGEGIDRVDIQSQVSLTTRPVSPTVHDLFLLTYLVLCESGGMFPRTRLLSATLPTSLAPVTFLKRGHLSPGPRKSKQSPCSCGGSKDHLAHSISLWGLGFSSFLASGGIHCPSIYLLFWQFLLGTGEESQHKDFLLAVFGLQEPSS